MAASSGVCRALGKICGDGPAWSPPHTTNSTLPGGGDAAHPRREAESMCPSFCRKDGSCGHLALPGTLLRVVLTNYETGESCGCVTYPVAFGGLGGLMPAPGQKPCWRPALPGTGSSGRRHTGLPFPWPRRIPGPQTSSPGTSSPHLSCVHWTCKGRLQRHSQIMQPLPTREPSQTPPTLPHLLESPVRALRVPVPAEGPGDSRIRTRERGPSMALSHPQ